MKQILPLAFIAAAALFSCSKGSHDGSHGSRSIAIDTTIASGSSYLLNLKSYGDADDVATIRTQATTYTTSEIVNTASGFYPVYHFSAAASSKNSLTEQVVIAITEGNHGQNHVSKDSTLVTINFKVQ